MTIEMDTQGRLAESVVHHATAGRRKYKDRLPCLSMLGLEHTELLDNSLKLQGKRRYGRRLWPVLHSQHFLFQGVMSKDGLWNSVGNILQLVQQQL